jgi:hypothetical protein
MSADKNKTVFEVWIIYRLSYRSINWAIYNIQISNICYKKVKKFILLKNVSI